MVDPKLISVTFKSEKQKKKKKKKKKKKSYILHGPTSIQAPKIISLISLHFVSIIHMF